MKRSIPTIVIEERTLLREGVVSLLHGTCYKVVASVASASEVADMRLSPRRSFLVILGVWGGLDEASRRVQSVRGIIKDCKIVAIGERFRDPDFLQVSSTGVDAILSNVSSNEALLKALDLVLIGQQLMILGQPPDSDLRLEAAPPLAPGYVSMDTTTKPDTGGKPEAKNLGAGSLPSPHALLSEREQQILPHIARGESNKVIARALSIREATVKVHLQSILRKISVRNRTQAALWAVENGLLSGSLVPSNGVSSGSRLPYDNSLLETSCDLDVPLRRRFDGH